MWERIKNKINDWFAQSNDRSKLIEGFNSATKLAYISGEMPTLLKAKISVGNRAYTHTFSRLMGGGFRIQAMAGRKLTKEEMQELGAFILFNDAMVRELVSIGFDTLELHSDVGNIGLQWQLTKYTNIGGILN